METVPQDYQDTFTNEMIIWMKLGFPPETRPGFWTGLGRYHALYDICDFIDRFVNCTTVYEGDDRILYLVEHSTYENEFDGIFSDDDYA